VIAFTQIALTTQRGPRRALVATPTKGDVRLGRERLLALRTSLEPSMLDLEIVARAKEAKAQLMIFRGRNDLGDASYGFDDRLDERSTLELGRLLVESQLHSYRKLAAAGVLCIVHTDLGFREVSALREGSRLLLEEVGATLDSEAKGDQALARVDEWALRNFSYFFSVSMARLLAETLPNLMPIIEQRAPNLSKLLANAGLGHA
jgi:hypothetical protein